MLKVFRNLLIAAGFVFLTGFSQLNDSPDFEAVVTGFPLVGNTIYTISNGLTAFTGSLEDKYDQWNLASKHISKELFDYAVKGYQYLVNRNSLQNTDYLTIADLSKPSNQKRLFIINVNTGEVVFETFVAHGRNSGQQWAKKFSNSTSSFASSLGFYITNDTYIGKHGYSLRLTGCESGINNNAYKRAIVLHGADYVSEEFIQQNGFLGRSLGCPAVPEALSEKIIDLIKNGSCLFVYGPSKKYLKQSRIINSRT